MSQDNESLMALAERLGVSFSVVKIIYGKGYHEGLKDGQEEEKMYSIDMFRREEG